MADDYDCVRGSDTLTGENLHSIKPKDFVPNDMDSSICIPAMAGLLDMVGAR